MNRQNYQHSITADFTAAETFEAINQVTEWWAKIH